MGVCDAIAVVAIDAKYRGELLVNFFYQLTRASLLVLLCTLLHVKPFVGALCTAHEACRPNECAKHDIASDLEQLKRVYRHLVGSKYGEELELQELARDHMAAVHCLKRQKDVFRVRVSDVKEPETLVQMRN